MRLMGSAMREDRVPRVSMSGSCDACCGRRSGCRIGLAAWSRTLPETTSRMQQPKFSRQSFAQRSLVYASRSSMRSFDGLEPEQSEAGRGSTHGMEGGGSKSTLSLPCRLFHGSWKSKVLLLLDLTCFYRTRYSDLKDVSGGHPQLFLLATRTRSVPEWLARRLAGVEECQGPGKTYYYNERTGATAR